MQRWLVESPVDLWLVDAPNAAGAIAAVKVFTTYEPLHAAPLPRLRYGQPRRVTFRDDRFDEPTAEPDVPRHSE